MNAQQHQQPYLKPMRTFCLSFFLGATLVLATPVAHAQTEPDTVRTKQQLPTGRPREEPTLPERQQPPDVRQAPAERTPLPPAGQTQPDVPAAFRKKLYVGGNFGLSLSGRFLLLDISPIVGYKITKKFSLGPGAVYQLAYSRAFSYSNYGAKVFTRFLFLPAFFAHAEQEVLSVPILALTPTNQYVIDHRVNVYSTFVGGGYRQRIGNRLALDTMLLFNLTSTDLSPYSNPVLRFGFYYEL